MSDWWSQLATDDDDYYNYAADEWVIIDRLDAANNANYTSWTAYYGPNLTASYNGDSFTNVQEYNYSSFIFDAESLQGNYASSGKTLYTQLIVLD